jgi:hypothetical protein
LIVTSTRGRRTNWSGQHENFLDAGAAATGGAILDARSLIVLYSQLARSTSALPTAAQPLSEVVQTCRAVCLFGAIDPKPPRHDLLVD